MSHDVPLRRCAFLLPGGIDGLTGGTIYDRRIVEGLRGVGWHVDLVSLSSSFPWPDATALEAAAVSVAALPDDSCVVADGLAFGAMPALARQHAQRLRWIALVHHPLALETGLEPSQRQQLFESERRALAAARGVIVTSKATARALARYGVADTRIHVVQPGTDPAALAHGSVDTDHGATCALLCVATLTPRKGHAVLFDALAGLQDRRWTLHCAGSMTRDPATTALLRIRIATLGLAQRVVLHGELGADALQALYARADAFVLASHYEGYGMALAEALARGLPIVSTTAGAIVDTVPADAGVLVLPGNSAALRVALARLLDEPRWRGALASGARAARARLADWPTAVARFAAALTDFEHARTAPTTP